MTPRPARPWPVLAAILAAAGCVFPRFSSPDLPPLPELPGAGVPLAGKAAFFERGMAERHHLPWGTLAYALRPPAEAEAGGASVTAYMSDQAAWTGVLLGAEAERWAATADPDARERVRAALSGLSLLNAVTGERGTYARYARPAVLPEREPHPHRWHDGAGDYREWRWIDDWSKDQLAGIVYGLAAVGDLVEDPWCRARAARLLGDLSDRVLGGGLALRDPGGERTTYGDLSPFVAGFPVGVNAAVALGLADAAARATGEPRHRRRFEALLDAGAGDALLFPTVRVLGKENWNNANMTAMALASVLRGPPPRGDPAQETLRARAEGSLARILALHRGEGNAFWIAVAAAAGEAAGVLARDLRDARAQLARFPLDRRERAVDHRGRPGTDRAFWTSKRGREQLDAPLRVDEMGAGSFVWKSNPYEALQETDRKRPRTYSGVDYLAAYWPLRRLGILGARE